MTPPRVTIGVPVFNGERYLAQTLDSLLNQRFQDFAIVVADNASTDRSGEIAREYAARDRRVRCVQHPKNLGAAANYNYLFRKAETEYFRWSASDDLSGPTFLEDCLRALDEDRDAVLAYPQIALIDAAGRMLEAYDERLHLPQPRPSDRFVGLLENIRLCNALYGVIRSNAMRRIRPMGSFRGSDIIFQAELALRGKFLEVPGPSFFRRMHPDAFNAMSRVQQRRFYNPDRRDRFEFYRWRHLREHLRSILRAPIGVTEQFRTARGLATWAVQGRQEFWEEVVTGARIVARRPD